MTIIRPNSISGINSITAKNTDQMKLYDSNGAWSHVRAGVITASSFSGPITGTTGNFGGDVTISGDLGVGGTITYEDVARVDATGISTFREGFKLGPLAGIALTAYKDGSIRSTGIVTAASFYGDGANLTGIDATQIVTGNTSVQTVDTGSDGHVKVTTEGSERLRIDSGGRLYTGASQTTLDSTAGTIHIDGGTSGGRIALRGTTTSAHGGLGEIFAYWGSNKVSGIIATAGTDTTNKDDGKLQFYTATGSGVVERLRIDSDGMSKFTRGSGGTVAHFYANARESNILIQNDARTWKIVNYDYGNNGTDNLGFHDGTADRMIIQNDGSVKIGDGDLIIGTSGHGINFSATADASTGGSGSVSSEILDDYEYGTFTPDLTRWTGSAWWGATWTTAPTYALGRYVKVGRLVTVTMRLAGWELNSSSYNKYAGIQGLPFAAGGSDPVGSLICTYAGSIFNTDTATSFWVTAGATTATSNRFGDDNGSHNVWSSGSNKTIVVSGSYYANA